MAWYPRNYFKLLLVILILILLQDWVIFVQCGNLKSISFLKEIAHNNLKFKCSPEILDIQAKIAFDASADYFINNPTLKLSFCRYLNVRNSLLYDFDKKSPYFHPNCYLGKFNNLHVNLQLTHKKIKNFVELSDIDVVGKKRPQYINEQIYIYNDYNQVFLNLFNLPMNKKLEIYNNCNLFSPKPENAIKTEKFLSELSETFFNCYKNGFGLK